MKVASLSLAVLLLYLPTPAPANRPTAEAGALARTLRIAGYDYALPAWWDTVNISVPANLKDWHAVSDFVTNEYEMDTGTRSNWRQALKTWAIASHRLDIFPVYLAHCHKTGGDYQRAAQIYTDLHQLAGGQKELKDWYHSYLAYSAGETYALMNDPAQARAWFERAAKYTGHPDNAVAHYAKESVNRVRMLDAQKDGGNRR